MHEKRPELPEGVEGRISEHLERLRIAEPEPARPRKRRWRPSRWLQWGVLAGLALLITGYAPRRGLQEQCAVRLVPVRMQEVGVPPVVLNSIGYVVPARLITVAASTQGKIIELPVQENQRVKKDALLARLDDREARANLQFTQAERDGAARDLAVTKQLYERGVRSSVELERVQTAFQVASARLELAQIALERTVLRAPFAGTVIRKLRDAGEMLTLGVTAQGDPGTAIVTLGVLDPLEIELEINESEIRRLRPGMSALVSSESQPDRHYMGTLSAIVARVDRSKGVVPVRVRITDPDDQLLPNMSANVRFLSEPPRGEVTTQLAVPRSAIQKRRGQTVVFAVENEVARALPVVLAAGAGERPDAAPFSAVAARSEEAKTPVPLLRGPVEGTYVVENPCSGLETGSRVQAAP